MKEFSDNGTDGENYNELVSTKGSRSTELDPDMLAGRTGTECSGEESATFQFKGDRLEEEKKLGTSEGRFHYA
jgi:hypothetical protein